MEKIEQWDCLIFPSQSLGICIGFLLKIKGNTLKKSITWIIFTRKRSFFNGKR